MPQQVDPRVIGRVAARRALERIAAVDVDLLLAQPGDDIFELRAAGVGCDRAPVPLKLVGRHAVHAGACREPGRGQLYVALPDVRADRRLVGRLVPAEPQVTVGAVDLRLAVVGLEFCHQRRHRPVDAGLVDILVREPVRAELSASSPS